jgi:PTH1 family peptidyl-tRNA hydrolase
MVQRIIVGLGNPGKKYEKHRHNIGFFVLDALAARAGIRFERKMCRASIGEGSISHVPVILAKPQTFMNRSGDSVVRLLDYYDAFPEDLVIVHDDLDLEQGRIKLKGGGGDGGHNGLRSTIQRCGTGDFVRVRIGIDRPESGEEPADYVLSDFPDPHGLREIAAWAAEIIEYLLLNGLQAAMNRFHSNQ